MENKELVKVDAIKGCQGCYYSSQYTDGNGCSAPYSDWMYCIKEKKQIIFVEKDNVEEQYYEPHELIVEINEAKIACRPKGFYKDLSQFTNQWVSDKIKETWKKSTGHNPSYDTYIPFKLSNDITYIAYYTNGRLIGLVMLRNKSLKRCYFVNSNYQHIEVTSVEREAIEFKVISEVKKIEFDLNK